MKLLIIPMYRLLTTKVIDEIKYEEKHAPLYRRDYTLEERRAHFESLSEAMENPSYDFKSISPIFSELKFSNEEIFLHLKKVYNFMKDNRLHEE
jgi:hypothetical protein